MNSSYMIYAVINTVFVLLISPLLMGLVKIVKARVQRRKGPKLMQPYYNLAKLMRKERLYSTTSSSIMRTTPYINIAAVLTASLCVPLIYIPEVSLGVGNLILFLYLLALAKFFMCLAGLDAGSTFGGMGSSREMSISALVEPVTIVALAALAYTLDTTDIYNMFKATSASGIPSAEIILASIPLYIVLIAENARIPVDNPETHLELTMVHEAMVLEYSGSDLALMEVSHAVKQTLLVALLINILLPWGLASEPSIQAISLSALAFITKAGLLSIIIGATESSIAKMRFFSLPGLFMLAFFFSILTLLLEVFG